ncbi:pilus assembly protein CpaB [Rhodopseudomonas rhenobacensis]|uniref:Pilus assembly protein CpaB n=1 Tax=Rhodopseudomonas rhenobacensis TaxID=87461 RepID=A0A7W7Z4Y3_9BRAD|nr:Flp pilus assembly protein CpaB [Rhodopseudomonas rhenobacensis]MBB5048086.1 pilus assembly protein CpaB [Rhodopseudomonas rhenobacensis]
MQNARVIVILVALSAGAAAAFLAAGTDRPQPQVTVPAVAQLKTVDVLVAKSDIALGRIVATTDAQWQSWPADAASGNLIRRDQQPDAVDRVVGAIARSPFVAGEPIREAKLVRPNGSGFMAAVLPAGMRAISTEISPETGAGGFILPNDRVDVILSKRHRDQEKDIVSSEIILSNVRVLAIDQAPKERDGQNAVIGKTATLELKPEQAEALARARQAGTLSLALRSLVDVNLVAQAGDETQITVYKGQEREFYSCTPLCQRR